MDNETKFPGPVTILKQSWQIYKNRFWVLLGIYVVPALLLVVVIFVAGGAAAIVGLLGVRSSNALLVGLIVLAALVYLGIIYVSLWSQTALLFAIKGADQKVGFKESFHEGSQRVFSLLGAALLILLAIMGVTLVGGGIIFALYHFLPKITGLFIVEGLLGLILTLWIMKLSLEFSLVSYVVVGDNVTAMSAVQRSRDYMKGYWWRIFWRILFLMLFVLVYYVIIVAITYIFGGIHGPAGQIIGSLVTFVLSVVFVPFLLIYPYQLYANLKQIKGESHIPANKKSAGLIVLGIIVLIVLVLALFFMLLKFTNLSMLHG